MFSNNRIYLDNSACTKLDNKVAKKMADIQKSGFGDFNPSSIHSGGVRAKELLEETRKKVSRFFHSQSSEIIFTSSGSESANLAILGVVKGALSMHKKPHIIISNIEHVAVSKACEEAKQFFDAEVSIVCVDQNGLISPEEIKKELKENTVLVSVMHANNEIGTIQPIKEIARVIAEFKKDKTKEYPFLLEHNIGFNIKPIERMLIPRSSEILRAIELKDYIEQRNKICRYSSLIDNECITANTFGVRYASMNSGIQKIRQAILATLAKRVFLL
jgi:hypothetical protein